MRADLAATATHCNTLRHTATHCNTLQHTPQAATTRDALHAKSEALREATSARADLAATAGVLSEKEQLVSQLRRSLAQVLQCVAVCCSVLQCILKSPFHLSQQDEEGERET